MLSVASRCLAFGFAPLSASYDTHRRERRLATNTTPSPRLSLASRRRRATVKPRARSAPRRCDGGEANGHGARPRAPTHRARRRSAGPVRLVSRCAITAGAPPRSGHPPLSSCLIARRRGCSSSRFCFFLRYAPEQRLRLVVRQLEPQYGVDVTRRTARRTHDRLSRRPASALPRPATEAPARAG